MTALSFIILAVGLLLLIAKLIDVALFGSTDEDWFWSDPHDPRPMIRQLPETTDQQRRYYGGFDVIEPDDVLRVPYDWERDCPDV